MNLINGTIVSDEELQKNWNHYLKIIVESAESFLDRNYLIDLLDQFSLSLKNSNDELSHYCNKNSVKHKIKKELGDDPFTLRKQSYREDCLEAWSPLGLVTHILPSNAPELPPFAIIEGLLAGNVNIIKLSGDNRVSVELMLELLKLDSCNILKPKIAILNISSSDSKRLADLYRISNGVSAWGGDSTIESIRSSLPFATRFIPWGHKISFGYLTSSQYGNNEALSKLAKEIVSTEQQACSAPQFLYCEDASFEQMTSIAEQLAAQFETLSKQKPIQIPTIAEKTEITNFVQLAKLESHLMPIKVFEGSDYSWRIVVSMDSNPIASPLYRTLILKPIKREQIGKMLRPIRNYLQTVGIVSLASEIQDLSSKMILAGVTRITSIGSMVSSYDGEPHDGVYALQRFCNRVSIMHEQASRLARIPFAEINSSSFVKQTAIMSKEDFKKQKSDRSLAHLYFKSGGSSGTPTLSTFSYDGYHREMAAAAEGLFAAGLNPKVDRVMNCFFCGSLYGGFLSFFTILEKLEVVQFPMAAHQDYEFVASIICDNHVNTILGMPSYLIQLFTDQKDKLKKYKTIKKIFYGGEHFSLEQRKWLQDEFGVEVIRSASYGSVDAGPLGFQCEYCVGGEHHLNDQLHTLEILELEKDHPVASDNTGRLVITSRYRESLKVQRYDIGDLGRWILSPCKCGRANPKFELMGRHGDIFRAGGNFLNYTIFKNYLGELFDYHQEFQIIITKTIAGDHICLNLLDDRTNEIKSQLLSNYDWLIDAVVVDKTVSFEVNKVSLAELCRTPGSGKLIRVLDKR